MPTKPATLRSMPRCEVSADGLTIEFEFATDDGTQRFAVHPHGLLEIVARLVGAQGEANKRAMKGFGPQPMLVGPYEVGADTQLGLALLRLSPAPDAQFDFRLSPVAARQIGQALVQVAANLSAPRPATKPN